MHFCALLLLCSGEEVLSGSQSRGTQSLGSACGSAEEVEPPKEQSRALPAQEPKPQTLGFHFPLEDTPRWPC